MRMPDTASTCPAFSFPEVFCNLPHAVRRRQLSFLPKKSIESIGKMTLFRFVVLKFPVNLPVFGIFCPPFLSGITYKAYWRSARHDLEFQHALGGGSPGHQLLQPLDHVAGLGGNGDAGAAVGGDGLVDGENIRAKIDR